MFWIVPLRDILVLKVKSDFRMEETKLKQGSPDSHWSYLELDPNVMLFVTIALVKSCYS